MQIIIIEKKRAKSSESTCQFLLTAGSAGCNWSIVSAIKIQLRVASTIN